MIMILASSSLVGCKTYSSSFACGDAKGAKCVSMDRVDRMITSGEIERFNEERNCSGGGCKYKNKRDKELSASMPIFTEQMVEPESTYYLDVEDNNIAEIIEDKH